jgi:hypothetical protein
MTNLANGIQSLMYLMLAWLRLRTLLDMGYQVRD